MRHVTAWVGIAPTSAKRMGRDPPTSKQNNTMRPKMHVPETILSGLALICQIRRKSTTKYVVHRIVGSRICFLLTGVSDLATFLAVLSWPASNRNGTGWILHPISFNMKFLPFAVSAVLAIGLVVALNAKIGPVPPLGKFLSPSHGIWRNAEADDQSFSATLAFTKLQDSTNVYFDERLVPHVFAQNQHDLYFIQGFLAAKFRLWQMEFQTHAAAGRLCEVLGQKVGTSDVLEGSDRRFRRLGLMWAAEKNLKALQNDSVLNQLNAYAEGVNSYLEQLEPADYPIEYKLLDYAPEKWTPIKSLLLMKYMAYDLANDGDDFAQTNLLQHVGIAKFEQMFPIASDSLDPILPKGTPMAITTSSPKIPAQADSLYFSNKGGAGIAYNLPEKHPDAGSNNWVVSGSRTASGRPILCNDPHLSLSMPSLWYEVQLHVPGQNTYGVCLQGVPGVLIGFNDSISWALTNAMRDVMDFYEVKFKDSTLSDYWYDSAWRKTEWRTETIRIRDKADFSDKVPYTVWGPVMFDGTFQSDFKDGKTYALHWKAHQPDNAVGGILALNRAKNANDFWAGMQHVGTPGQNFVMATKTNTIAWWQHAQFPAKWRRQGDFIMPGWDSTFAWQGDIAAADNVHAINPERGFLSSANQLPADTTYPFYMGGLHDVYRGIIINRMLKQQTAATVDGMKAMQTNNYNVFAQWAVPFLLGQLNTAALTPKAESLLPAVRQWNLQGDYEETGMTIFLGWWNKFKELVWNDDITRPDGLTTAMPYDETLLDGVLRDSVFPFVDDTRTDTKETTSYQVTAALNAAAEDLVDMPSLAWGKVKDTRIRHLLQLDAFSQLHLPIGGGSKMINATTEKNGPSWRMIVQMTDSIEAWGVFPGGQSGNPGSKFYNSFVNHWATGQYYRLWFMQPNEPLQQKVRWQMRFLPARS
ncbi:MAG: penicillin acylase family protein [Bacteroidetes bacterium]|nr:MAG: penicillin acylase family protein [Bacteroidota bacterium]